MDWTGLVVGMIKALGSGLGAFLALVFQPPATTRELLIRSAFSFACGMIFGDPLREQYLKWPERWEYWLASAALVALVSWAVYGAAIRIIGAYKGPK